MKKAIVDYNNESPIALREVKEFKDENSYKAFEALCKVNKAKKDKADEEAVAVAVAREKAEAKDTNKRVAWIALLWTELQLDHGSFALTDEEYSSFMDNFNLGDIKSLDDMPSTFKEVYNLLKEEL